MTVKFLLKQESAVASMNDAYLKACHFEKMKWMTCDAEAFEDFAEEQRKAIEDLRKAESEYEEAVCEEVMES